MKRENLKRISLRLIIFVIATIVISVVAVFILNKRTEQLEQELAKEMEADIIIPSFADETKEGGETDPDNTFSPSSETDTEETDATSEEERTTKDSTSEAMSDETGSEDETDISDTDEATEDASEDESTVDVITDEIEATTEEETQPSTEEGTTSPTTVAPTNPTTEAHTTVPSTTVAPTTVAPTTVAPTTVAPTTSAPTSPTTAAPTTPAPTTEVHVHQFSAADCYNPEKCSCGATGNPALGHDFGSNNETCSRCGTANPNYVKPVEPPHLIAGVAESRTNITEAQMSVFKNRVLQGLNNLRAEKGLGGVSSNDFLISGAVLRSQEIPVAWSHTRPNGDRGIYVMENCGGWYAEAIDALRTGKGYNCAFGENLAVVYSYSDYAGTDQEIIELADEMVANWKASETHYNNIIYAGFNNIGLGVTVNLVEEDGVVYHAFWACTLFSN